MGHFVTGIIASPELLDVFAKQRSLRPPVALTGGLAMLPVRDRDLDSFLPVPLTGKMEGFAYLSDQLLSALAEASLEGKVLYFETEYFGGVGAQGAVVLHLGHIIYGPHSSKFGPINEALTLLGVRVQAPAHDEFDTVGLGRCRSTADWLGVDDDDDGA